MAQGFIGLKRFAWGTIPQLWFNLVHSRGASKLSKFYMFAAVIFILQGAYSIMLHLSMLATSENSKFFDFQSTKPEATSLTAYGCSVEPLFPFAFWHGISLPLANYVFLTWVVLASAVLALTLAVSALLLSFSFRHFQNLPRKRFAHPHLSDKMFGILCKGLPSLTNMCLWLLIVVLVVPLIFIFFFNVCGHKLFEASGSLRRIQNCRLWVRKCVGDDRKYGRHLQCSITDNYRAFPAEPCGPDEVVHCIFPRSHLGIARITRSGIIAQEDSHMTVEHPYDICDGEYVPSNDGGPVPFCPMCTNARRDPTTKVYNKDIEPSGKLRVAVPVRQRPTKRARFKSFQGMSTLELAGSLLQSYPKHNMDENDVENLENTEQDTPSKSGELNELAAKSVAELPPLKPDITSSKELVESSPKQNLENVESSLPKQQINTVIEDTNNSQNKETNRIETSPTREIQNTSVASRSHRSKRRRHRKKKKSEIMIPWPTYRTAADAFYVAYMDTMNHFTEGSYSIRMIYIWALCSLFLIFLYKISLVALLAVVPPDGYFTTPAAKGELKALPGQILTRILNILTFGKWDSSIK